MVLCLKLLFILFERFEDFWSSAAYIMTLVISNIYLIFLLFSYKFLLFLIFNKQVFKNRSFQQEKNRCMLPRNSYVINHR